MTVRRDFPPSARILTDAALQWCESAGHALADWYTPDEFATQVVEHDAVERLCAATSVYLDGRVIASRAGDLRAHRLMVESSMAALWSRAKETAARPSSHADRPTEGPDLYPAEYDGRDKDRMKQFAIAWLDGVEESHRYLLADEEREDAQALFVDKVFAEIELSARWALREAAWTLLVRDWPHERQPERRTHYVWPPADPNSPNDVKLEAERRASFDWENSLMDAHWLPAVALAVFGRKVVERLWATRRLRYLPPAVVEAPPEPERAHEHPAPVHVCRICHPEQRVIPSSGSELVDAAPALVDAPPEPQLVGAPPGPQPYGVSPEGAERLAAAWMEHLGAAGVEVTRSTKDGGLDVIASRYVAQVKAWAGPVGVVEVRALAGVTAYDADKRSPLFFATTGYTTEALAFATHAADMALFILDAVAGTLTGVTPRAVMFRERGL